MKIVYNKFIPFKGYFAINLFGTYFIREEYRTKAISKRTINHESIHTDQALDFVFGCKKLQILGYIMFYILYLIEWLIKLIPFMFTLGKVKVYHSISFEQCAYNNENDLDYLQHRKRFAWAKYIFKLVK